MTEYEFKRETFHPNESIELPDGAVVLNGSRSWDVENQAYRHIWVEYLDPK